jgi:hypothetical protein
MACTLLWTWLWGAFAYFVRHYGNPPSCFARAGGFNGGVQGQAQFIPVGDSGDAATKASLGDFLGEAIQARDGGQPFMCLDLAEGGKSYAKARSASLPAVLMLQVILDVGGESIGIILGPRISSRR